MSRLIMYGLHLAAETNVEFAIDYDAAGNVEQIAISGPIKIYPAPDSDVQIAFCEFVNIDVKGLGKEGVPIGHNMLTRSQESGV